MPQQFLDEGTMLPCSRMQITHWCNVILQKNILIHSYITVRTCIITLLPHFTKRVSSFKRYDMLTMCYLSQQEWFFAVQHFPGFTNPSSLVGQLLSAPMLNSSRNLFVLSSHHHPVNHFYWYQVNLNTEGLAERILVPTAFPVPKMPISHKGWKPLV